MLCWLRSQSTTSMETMLTWELPVENTSVSAASALSILVILISSRLHRVSSNEATQVVLASELWLLNS